MLFIFVVLCRAQIRSNCFYNSHWAGTARMGNSFDSSDSEEGAAAEAGGGRGSLLVLDPQLRVRGVKRLRVAGTASLSCSKCFISDVVCMTD